MTVTASLDDGLARATLDHPPLNILTRAVLAELRAVLAQFAAEPAVRVLLLDAAGPHFSAGADVGEHLPPAYKAMIAEFLDTVAALAAFPLPVIAAVQGRCLGGGFELVQATDLVIAADTASVGQPEIRLGVFPPAACVLLPARATPGAAAELVYTGDAVSAAEAGRMGLVARVVPEHELGEAALALARRISRHSGAALRIAKRALALGDRAPRDPLHAAGRLYVADLMRTADAVEGLTAFQQKRRPAWSHA